LKGAYRSPRYVTDCRKEFILREGAKYFKTCSKCGETKLISKFSIDRRNFDGHLGVCKSCKSLYYKERYREQKEKYLEKSRIWRLKHIESVKTRQKKYREENRELFRKRYLENRKAFIEKAKKYYQEHKEACLMRDRAWKIKNRDKIREYNKKYRQKHAVRTL